MSLLQQKVLVVDRGSKNYKGILIEFSWGNFKILQKESLPFQNEIASINEEHQKPIWEYNLIRYLETLFPQEKELILLLNEEEVFVRKLTIPAEKEEVVLQVLENEIEAYIPVALEEVQVLGITTKIEKDEAKVLGFAVKNEIIESYINSMHSIGINPKMLGLESLALSSALELLIDKDYTRKTILQLDIGYSKTIINILDNGKLSYTRQIPFGVRSLLNVLEPHFEKQPNEVEKFLFENFDKLINKESIEEIKSQKDIEEIQKNLYEEWDFFIQEVKRTLYAAEVELISYSYLSGGGSLIQGIQEILERDLNIQMRRYQITLGDDPIETWIIAIGGFLHFRKSQSQKEKIDFLNTPLGKSLKKGEIRIEVFYLPISFFGIAIIIFLISFILKILLDQRQSRFYESQIREVAQTIPDVGNVPNPVQRAKKVCEEKLNYWKNITIGIKFLEIIKEIENHMLSPEIARLEFKSLRYTEDQINLELIVDNIANVVKVQEELQKSRMFSMVEVVRRDLIAGQKVRLELSLKIKQQDTKLEIDCK